MARDGNKLVPITGLWQNESKSGEVYFRGKLGMATVLIFENKYKNDDRSPDFRMFLAPPEDDDESGGGRGRGRGGNGGGGRGRSSSPPPMDDDMPPPPGSEDDIPF